MFGFEPIGIESLLEQALTENKGFYGTGKGQGQGKASGWEPITDLISSRHICAIIMFLLVL